MPPAAKNNSAYKKLGFTNQAELQTAVDALAGRLGIKVQPSLYSTAKNQDFARRIDRLMKRLSVPGADAYLKGYVKLAELSDPKIFGEPHGIFESPTLYRDDKKRLPYPDKDITALTPEDMAPFKPGGIAVLMFIRAITAGMRAPEKALPFDPAEGAAITAPPQAIGAAVPAPAARKPASRAAQLRKSFKDVGQLISDVTKLTHHPDEAKRGEYYIKLRNFVDELKKG